MPSQGLVFGWQFAIAFRIHQHSGHLKELGIRGTDRANATFATRTSHQIRTAEAPSMTPLNMPFSAASTMHSALRTHIENSVDLRDLALWGNGAEVVWVLIPVCVVADNTKVCKRVADGVPTLLEFSRPQVIGQS